MTSAPGSFADLPPVLVEIAEVVGIDAALAIAAVQGGQYARIGSRLSDDNWLVQAIGREKAEQLSFHYLSGKGRFDLYIPIGPSGSYLEERRNRAARVAIALENGMSIKDAARAVGITRRSVHAQKAKLRSGGGQGSLF
jgi:hypothetical protein